MRPKEAEFTHALATSLLVSISYHFFSAVDRDDTSILVNPRPSAVAHRLKPMIYLWDNNNV